MQGDWRLGEELWRGRWHQASGQAVPWKGRTEYGALCLGPAGPTLSPTLLVLGGLDGDAGPLNDVWRSDDEGQSWELFSPHDAGRRDGGNLLLRKWIGRSAFATAASWSYKGGRLAALVYVVGGNGPKSKMADVWVSQDLGRTFVRMCADAPFGARSHAGLVVCPGCPERLILSGGMTGLDVYRAAQAWNARAAGEHWDKGVGDIPLDCWVSLDAGEHWDKVSAPEVQMRTAPKLHFAGQESLLLLGGSSVSMVGQALVVSRQPVSDAFSADVDWEGRRLRWQPVAVLDAGGEPFRNRPPLQAEFVAGALRSRQLVACSGDEVVDDPQPAKDSNGPQLAVVEPVPRQNGVVQHVLLPSGGLSVLLLTSSATFTTRPVRGSANEQRTAPGPPEGLWQQLLFMNWLGAKLELLGLPSEVWSKVVSLVFLPRALALPGLPCQRLEWRKALERAVREIGDSVRICVLGPSATCNDNARELAAAMGAYLDAGLDSKVALVTRGMAGVEQVFAENCGDGSQVFNMLPIGQASGYDSGRDVHPGVDASQFPGVFSRLGVIYIVFGGGADVAEVALAAHEQGALLVPLALSSAAAPGGSAALPLRTLERPAVAREEAWELLQDVRASPNVRAQAAAEVVAGCILMRETAGQAAARLTNWFGDYVKVCLLAADEPQEEDAELLSLVSAIACELDACLDGHTSFIISGLAAIQRTFFENCGDGGHVYNLLPANKVVGPGRHRELRAGADPAQCRETFSRLGDIYIALGGGPEVAKQARMVAERGAYLLPVISTGGAASGRFDFPRAALEKPAALSEECWALLADRSAGAAPAAAAVVDAVAAAAGELHRQRDKLREAAQRAEEEAQRKAKEEAERRAQEELERRRWEEAERRAREEKASITVSVINTRGVPCGVVQLMPDDRIGHLRQLAQATSPLLNSGRFMLMVHTMSLPDDLTLTEAGLRNGSVVTAASL